jgi:hypothetical protein
MDARIYTVFAAQSNNTVWSLHYGDSRAILTVIPDAIWPGMHRIHWPDGGGLSDIGNLTRIKDAAEVIAERGPPPRNRRDLRWKQAGQPRRGSLVSQPPKDDPHHRRRV